MVSPEYVFPAKNISKSVNIYSPIDGFVSKVNVNIGKYVNPADILFELINPDDIHLNLKVFEKLNDIPQALLEYRTPKEVFRYQLEEMIKNSSDEISVN